jgi:hypothetical protein
VLFVVKKKLTTKDTAKNTKEHPSSLQLKDNSYWDTLFFEA